MALSLRMATPTSVALSALHKASLHRSALGELWEDVQALARMVRAYSRRQYTAVPWRTIAAAVGALAYFVNPLDAVPDYLPGLGYVDDSVVVALVIGSIKTELERFTAWEKAKASDRA